MRAVRESDGIIEKSAGIDDECRGICVKRDGVSGNRIAQDTCFFYRLWKRPETAGGLVTAQDKCMVVTAREEICLRQRERSFSSRGRKSSRLLREAGLEKSNIVLAIGMISTGNMFLVIQADIVCENGECLIKRGR